MPRKLVYKKKIKRPVRPTKNILNQFTKILSDSYGFKNKGKINMKDNSQIAKYILNLNLTRQRKKRVNNNRKKIEGQLLQSVVSVLRPQISDTEAMNKIRKQAQKEDNKILEPTAPKVIKEVPPYLQPEQEVPLILHQDEPGPRVKDPLERIQQIVPKAVIEQHAPELIQSEPEQKRELQQIEEKYKSEPEKIKEIKMIEKPKQLEESIARKFKEKAKKSASEKVKQSEEEEEKQKPYDPKAGFLSEAETLMTYNDLEEDVAKKLMELEKDPSAKIDPQIDAIMKLKGKKAVVNYAMENENDLLDYSTKNDKYYYRNNKGKRIYMDSGFKNPKGLINSMIRKILEKKESSSEEEGKGKSIGRGLWDDEINEIMKSHKNFLGSFGVEEIPEILKEIKKNKPEKFSFILNPGEHWVACNCDGLSLEFYDPLCEWEPTKEFYKDFKHSLDYFPHLLKYKINDIKQQSDSSANCGFFCCRFLKERDNDVSFKEATNWPKTIKENEDEIKHFKKIQGFGYI